MIVYKTNYWEAQFRQLKIREKKLLSETEEKKRLLSKELGYKNAG